MRALVIDSCRASYALAPPYYFAPVTGGLAVRVDLGALLQRVYVLPDLVSCTTLDRVVELHQTHCLSVEVNLASCDPRSGRVWNSRVSRGPFPPGKSRHFRHEDGARRPVLPLNGAILGC
jgi:hypothetical protein